MYIVTKCKDFLHLLSGHLGKLSASQTVPAAAWKTWADRACLPSNIGTSVHTCSQPTHEGREVSVKRNLNILIFHKYSQLACKELFHADKHAMHL